MQLYATFINLSMNLIALLFIAGVTIGTWGVILTYHPETPDILRGYRDRALARIQAHPLYQQLRARFRSA
jgi:hypothetical protein